MSDVHSLHQEVIISDYGTPLSRGAAIDRDIFANRVVIAHLGGGHLSTKFEILRDGTDDGTGEYRIMLTDTGTTQQCY